MHILQNDYHSKFSLVKYCFTIQAAGAWGPQVGKHCRNAGVSALRIAIIRSSAVGALQEPWPPALNSMLIRRKLQSILRSQRTTFPSLGKAVIRDELSVSRERIVLRTGKSP